MKLYDFHHHKTNQPNGIYNLKQGDQPSAIPFSAGIHPWNLTSDYEENYRWLREVSQHKNCVAIGECGLDIFAEKDLNVQKTAFRKQIEWAVEIQKPVIIHCVRLFHELIPFRKMADVPMIVHGFNKKKMVADDLLKHGFYLSFGEAVLHHLYLQEIVREIPPEKLFLETDDADFEIAELYEKVSSLKSITVEELSEQIQKNLEDITHG